MLINVKMPTIVDILTSMSSINFDLSYVEHEKRFITSRLGVFDSLIVVALIVFGSFVFSHCFVSVFSG